MGGVLAVSIIGGALWTGGIIVTILFESKLEEEDNMRKVRIAYGLSVLFALIFSLAKIIIAVTLIRMKPGATK